jgi:hypothetical protein
MAAEVFMEKTARVLSVKPASGPMAAVEKVSEKALRVGPAKS